MNISVVAPDILSIARGMATRSVRGICMTRAALMSWMPGSHASTFGGNPVCIAAARATMDIIGREAMQNAAAVGAKMLERLRPWVKKHANVGDVRGRGLMIGIEIVKINRVASPWVRCAIVL